jgi:response regulator RpfG family c-di-GMP phosphodiesterase
VAGALALLVAAAIAEAYPVPVEGVSAGGVSLAAAFLVGAALIYDWQTATLLALLARGTIEVIQRRPFVRLVYTDWVFHHHERWDGMGYPSGLKGEEIPLGARIIFVADAFDAITSPRPYRPAATTAEALAEIRRCAGSQFDPAVVDALVAELPVKPEQLAPVA